MAPYGTSTQALRDLVDDEDEITDALESASLEMDEAFQTGGYAVPIDVSTIADTTLRARVTAFLKQTCRAKAAFQLSAGLGGEGRRGQPSHIKKNADRCEAMLERIRKGLSQLPGVPRSSDQAAFGNTGLTAVVGEGRQLEDVRWPFDGLDAISRM